MPVKIFFCYAHEDEQFLNKLKSHLIPLQRQGLIDVWHDRDISAGTDWGQQIKGHLNAAQIILLLVSPDFMASDYCYSIEMKRALERDEQGEARVIPIILRHVYWQGVLGKLQALPKDGIPITDPDWYNIDRALYNVTEGIRKVVEEITPKSSSPSPVLSTQPVLPTLPPTNLPNKVQKTKEQWLKEGKRLLDLKRFEEGLEACEQAIRLDPNDAAAYNNKGYALNELKRFEEGLEACEQAIRLDPNDAAAYINKGYALNALKWYQEGLEACEQAIRLDSNEAWAYYNKGDALINLNRYQEALVAFEQAIRLDPNFAWAYFYKGLTLEQLNRKGEAQQAYEKARQLGYSG